jgi:hypothetical protein
MRAPLWLPYKQVIQLHTITTSKSLTPRSPSGINANILSSARDRVGSGRESLYFGLLAGCEYAHAKILWSPGISPNVNLST